MNFPRSVNAVKRKNYQNKIRLISALFLLLLAILNYSGTHSSLTNKNNDWVILCSAIK
jgi:hypothetical protein